MIFSVAIENVKCLALFYLVAVGRQHIGLVVADFGF